MKRKLVVLLAVIMVAISIVIASGCNNFQNCEHEVSEYISDTSTCEESGKAVGICLKCGKQVEITVPAHHRFEDGECVLCGEVDELYWNGTSIPTIKNLETYTKRYLPNIQADSYVDFATSHIIDLKKHPDLYDTGMFWCYYDEELGSVKEVSIRDTDEIDRLIEQGYIDPSKPTTLFTHGMAVGEYQRAYDLNGDEIITGGRYSSSIETLDPENPDYADYVEPSTGTVNVNLIYLKNGYNVLNFSYRRFADELPKTNTEECADGEIRNQLYINNMIDESKIFTTEGPAGMRYRYPDGTFSDGATKNGVALSEAGADETNGVVREDIDFTIAEFYASEYVRMFNYMVEKNVFSEDTFISVSGHSMGGVVTVMGNFLISELARVEQIPSYYLADRIILGDSYLGMYSPYGENVPDYDEVSGTEKISLMQTKMLLVYGYKVHWTGKELDGCGSFGCYISALYTLSKTLNIPVEYYVDTSFSAFPTLPASTVKHLVWSLCAVQMYNLKFKTPSTHNSIREIRVAEIINGLHPTLANGEIAVCSILTNEEIKERTGKIYVLVEGNETPDLKDDVFEIRTIEEMMKK